MVKKFTIPFASQGDANDIPDALQVDGKVSFTQGFGYDYERPYDDPQAKDIAREDMNGLFKAITSAVGELQTLGASEWSSAIAYPKGAIVYYEKDLYISQVDDNQNKPPQGWVSITNIANDSLKKAANLSDLTNKATARSNLGLGSSATLNKTDVLGTSTSLVATQKLVNDTKINLDNSVRAVDIKSDNAQSTANTAVTKADNAQSRADSAYNLANTSVQKNQITNSLGNSTELVASQALVNSTNNKIDYALVDFGLIDSKTTYEKECPFGDSPVITMLEIYVDGKWYEVKALSMIFVAGNNMPIYGGFSTKLGSSLCVQRGDHGFALEGRISRINTLINTTVSSANARVHVWRIGK